MILLSNNTDYQLDIQSFEQLSMLVLQGELGHTRSTVSLLICDDPEMQAINHKWRGLNKHTDVISFSADMEGMSFLGDIIIDIQQALRQKGDKLIADELHILFLHGLLHLLGYDHLHYQEKIKMEAKEMLYYTKFKEMIISRGV